MSGGDGLRNVVDAECGGSNALVSFGNRLVQNKRLHFDHGAAGSSHDQMTDQFLSQVARKSAAPASFSMSSLVSNLPDHQRASHLEAVKWSSEFVSMAHPPSLHAQWTQQYNSPVPVAASPALATPTLMNRTWHDMSMARASGMLTPASTSSLSLNSSTQWSNEYLERFDQSSSSTKHVSFDERAETWAAEYANQSTDQDAQAEQHDYWDSLQAEWEKLGPDGTGEYDWLSSPKSIYDEYVTESSNPYLEVADPVAEGERLMALGDLANAILHFEAATQKNQLDAKAWRLLGIAQSENECESKAIAALRRSLALEPHNQETLFALAVAYTNECLYNDAMNSMAAWLDANPTYSQYLDSSVLQSSKSGGVNSYTSFMDRDLFERIERAYLQAAASQPGHIDAQLQNSLGVLYNIGGNFERAIDSFQAALQVQTEDARTWNRLGATLANSSSDRTAEAINAYSQALQLYPGFVRARCNLAISCLHLKAYPQAVEHFVGALQLQNRGLGPTAEKSMSDSIWQSMRMAALHLPDSGSMLNAIQSRDLDGVQRMLGANVTTSPAAEAGVSTA